jgi:hypothetical protein
MLALAFSLVSYKAFLDEKKRKENKKDRRLPQDLGNGSWFLLGFFLRPRVILS